MSPVYGYEQAKTATEGIRFHLKRRCSLQSSSDSLSKKVEALKEKCVSSVGGSRRELSVSEISPLRQLDIDFKIAFPSEAFVSTDTRFS